MDDTPTLGGVIDGFFRLSDSDKAIFMAATGLSCPVASSLGNPGDKASPNLMGAVPFGPAQVFPPVASGGKLPVGTIVPKTPAQQQAAGLVRPGSTVDPKTLKVFRLQAPKEHSAERSALETQKESARLALTEYCFNNSIYLENGVPRVDLSTDSGLGDDAPLSVELSTRKPLEEGYNSVLSEFNAAKAALANYKLAHPDEFRPPAQGSGARGRGRGGSVRGRGRGGAIAPPRWTPPVLGPPLGQIRNTKVAGSPSNDGATTSAPRD